MKERRGRVSWRADPVELLDAVVSGMRGEQRAGQHELATAVANAIAGGHHLLAEAPTGAGKSLAYLAPAVASGLKVVIATSTIALQTQLAQKDVPSVQRHGRVPFAFAVLKGRGNYVCRAKLRAAKTPDALFEVPVGRGFPRQLERLEAFARRSPSGDRSEVADDINNATWAAVSCSGSECPGKGDCQDGADCFAELARENAREASILIVNHALYCAHLASHGQVLPDHDIVILDEAHAFVDNATSAFAAEVTADAVIRLSTMLARSGVAAAEAEAVADTGRALGKAIDGRDGTVQIGHDPELDQALLRAAERLARASAKLASGGNEYAKRTARIAEGRLEVLRRLAAPEADDVVWVERSRSNSRLRIAPVAAGDTIGQALLMHRPVIAVSATLGGEPPFSALAYQMGFQSGARPGSWGDQDEDGQWTSKAGRGYAAVQTQSSFDWRRQGVLYVAKELPEPRAPRRVGRSCRRAPV